MKYNIFLLIFTLIFSISCEKETENNNDNNDPTQEFEFVSLSAESYDVPVGEGTVITATATGNNLTYTWTVSAGTILGSGYQVTYTSDPCEPGENTVSCKVMDSDGKSDTKSIIINVGS
jgi:hypothetical protein